jgi:hypothetical protein
VGRSEVTGQIEPVGVGGQARRDNRITTRLVGRDDGGEPPLTRAQDEDRVANLRLAGDVDPLESTPHRIEKRRVRNRDSRRNLVHNGSGSEEHVVGEPTPDSRADLERGRAVDEPLVTDGILAAEAMLADPAGRERFDGDPIALVDAPPLRRVVANLLDPPDGFVAQYDWVLEEAAVVHLAVVPFVIGTTEATAFDPDERFTILDRRRYLKIPEFEFARRSLDGRSRRYHGDPSHWRWPLGRCCAISLAREPAPGRS